MKKTVTLVAFKRPEYTAKVLESLKANNLEGYTLIMSLEPGHEETRRVCETVDFMPHEVIVQTQNLGVNWHNKTIYDYVFRIGSELNVALEDDTPLSPDALDLANWYFENPELHNYAMLNCFSRSTNAERPADLFEWDQFCP